MKAQSVLEVNTTKIRENLLAMRKGHPQQIFGVVKADAYGLGAVRVANALHEEVAGFCVATVSEALILRRIIADKPILLFGYTDPDDRPELIRMGICPAISTLADAEAWNREAEKLGICAPIHIALDTGHRRIGFLTESDEAFADICAVAKLPHLHIEGLFSHFATADEVPFPHPFAREQLSRFRRMAERLKAAGISIPFRHIANDAGLLFFPDDELFDAARLGICLYGHYPSIESEAACDIDLQIPYRWTAPISRVKWMDENESVGYGRTWFSKRKTKVATVQVGYADGYPRILSGRAMMLVKGVACPVIGRICMDQLMLDVTDAPPVTVGDRVLVMGACDWEHTDSRRIREESERALSALFGDESASIAAGKTTATDDIKMVSATTTAAERNDRKLSPARENRWGISADSLAYRAGTISYELLTAIAPRVYRVEVK